MYNKIHWMDLPSKSNSGMTGYERNQFKIDNHISLNTVQKIQAKDDFTQKYGRRYQIGDIIEARRDGRPRGKKEEESFIFLRVPINLKDAIEYTLPLVNASDIVIRRRKYYIDMTGLIPDSHKNVILTEGAFNSRLKVKK